MFQVTGYETTDNTLSLQIRSGEELHEKDLSKQKFESWLKKEKKLLYDLIYHEPNSKLKLDGSMTLDEYWELSPEIIHQDIYSYIKDREPKLVLSLIEYKTYDD